MDTKMIKEIPAYLKSQFSDPYPLPSNIQNEAYYEGNPVPSNDWALAEGIVWQVGELFTLLTCAIFGHAELEDETTESQMEHGGFSMFCPRCGFGWRGNF